MCVWVAAARMLSTGTPSGFADGLADAVGSFVGQDLDVEIENDGRGFAVGQRERGGPQIEVDAFGLFMFLRAPTAVRNVWRRIGAAAGDAGEQS